MSSTYEGHPDLFSLLRGELSNAEVAGVGAHLETCEECRAELSEVAVGHALLAGTTRTLGERSPVALPEVPPLSAPASAPSASRWLRPLGLVAAAAALMIGTFAVTRWADTDEPAPQIAVPERSADLEPVEGNAGGRVEMTSQDDGVTMTVSTHDLPTIGDDEFYYVWLFDPTTEKMLPLGVVGPEGSASFRLPDSLVGRYQVVDVSLESDDGDPAHSVTSVLRATYA